MDWNGIHDMELPFATNELDDLRKENELLKNENFILIDKLEQIRSIL